MEGKLKVFVYWNLHKGLWSVRAAEGRDKGRVIARMPMLSLDYATFKVSEAGRQRVLRTGRKNVHAGVVGYVDLEDDGSLSSNTCAAVRNGGSFFYGDDVAYNPRLVDHFYVKGLGLSSGALTHAHTVNFFPDRSVKARGWALDGQP